MKRNLLFAAVIALGSTLTANAQTYYEEDFNATLTGWAVESLDGDTNTWMVDTTMGELDNFAFNFSWNGDPFTPDDIMITNAIDLTGATGSVTMNVDLRVGSDTSYFTEHYAIYAASTQTPTDFTSSTALLEETTDITFAQGWVTKTIDLTSYAGQTIYLAFRHYQSTDNWLFGVDDIIITGPDGPTPGGGGSTAVVDQKLNEGINVFPNPIQDQGTVTINLEEAGNVSYEIVNVLGAQVLAKNAKTLAAGKHNFSFNAAGLDAGIYYMNVTISDRTYTERVIIK